MGVEWVYILGMVNVSLKSAKKGWHGSNKTISSHTYKYIVYACVQCCTDDTCTF